MHCFLACHRTYPSLGPSPEKGLVEVHKQDPAALHARGYSTGFKTKPHQQYVLILGRLWFGYVVRSPHTRRVYVTFHAPFTAPKEACFMVTLKEGMSSGYLQLEN